jgi:hypothetical protein
LSVASDRRRKTDRSPRRARPAGGHFPIGPETLSVFTGKLSTQTQSPEQEIGRILLEPANDISGLSIRNLKRRRLAPAAEAPCCTASRAADACGATDNGASHRTSGNGASGNATSATDTASATPAPSCASATAATAASARSKLHAECDVFVVEEVEGGEADVGKLFFIERDCLAWDEVRRMFDVGCRHSRC